MKGREGLKKFLRDRVKGEFDYLISAKLFFGIRTFREGDIDAAPYENKENQKVTYIDRNKGSFKKQWSL
jgi:hypothetical protein